MQPDKRGKASRIFLALQKSYSTARDDQKVPPGFLIAIVVEHIVLHSRLARNIKKRMLVHWLASKKA